jgi:hypothetical protein
VQLGRRAAAGSSLEAFGSAFHVAAFLVAAATVLSTWVATSSSVATWDAQISFVTWRTLSNHFDPRLSISNFERSVIDTVYRRRSSRLTTHWQDLDKIYKCNHLLPTLDLKVLQIFKKHTTARNVKKKKTFRAEAPSGGLWRTPVVARSSWLQQQQTSTKPHQVSRSPYTQLRNLWRTTEFLKKFMAYHWNPKEIYGVPLNS